MELAKLFATVGFKVDTAGLTEFRKEMSDLKVQLKEAAVSTGKLKNQLTGLTAQFKAFQRMTDTRGVTKWMEGIQKSIVHLNNMQNQVGGNAQRSTHWADQFSASILKLHQALVGRRNEVAEYAQAVVHLAASFERLRAATAGMQRFRQVPANAVRGNNGNGGGGGGGGQGGGRRGGGVGDTQYQNYWGRARGVGASPLAAFMRPMLPTGMGMFNAVAAGYGVRELVAAGREMLAMEAKIKAISRSTQEFNDNLAFVRKTADTLAMPIEEVGQTFSNVFMASRDKMANNQIYKVYEGFAKYFKILQLTPEQTKLAMRAVNQMYNKEKVQAEELVGQLGERAAGVIQLFAKAFGGDVKKLFAAMKDGKVGVEYVTLAGEAAGKLAEESGALAEVTQNSASAQERFNNSMKAFSKAMMDAGLEKLLKELFKALTALARVAIPWVTKRLKALNGVVDTATNSFGFFKENVDGLTTALTALGGVLTVGGVLGFMGLLGSRIFWLTLNGLAAVAMFWQMHKVLIAKTAVIFLLIKAYSDIADAFNGEANWVTWMQYNLEMTMIYLERFYYMFIIWKNKFKANFDLGDFVTERLSRVPILSSLGGAIGRAAYDISTNGISFSGGAADLYKTKPAPNTKETRNTTTTVNINVDARGVQGVKDNPEKTAESIYKEMQKQWGLGGLGIYN